MYFDYLFGVVDGDGNKVFLNVEFILLEIDKGFWFDDVVMNGVLE